MQQHPDKERRAVEVWEVSKLFLVAIWSHLYAPNSLTTIFFGKSHQHQVPPISLKNTEDG